MSTLTRLLSCLVAGAAFLAVAAWPMAACAADVYEPNDVMELATPLAPNTEQLHAFEETATVDWIALSVTAGKAYDLTVAPGPEWHQGSRSAITVQVLDPGGDALGNVWYDPWMNWWRGRAALINSFVAPSDGTIYVRVSTPYAVGFSDYVVTAIEREPYVVKGRVRSMATGSGQAQWTVGLYTAEYYDPPLSFVATATTGDDGVYRLVTARGMDEDCRVYFQAPAGSHEQSGWHGEQPSAHPSRTSGFSVRHRSPTHVTGTRTREAGFSAPSSIRRGGNRMDSWSSSRRTTTAGRAGCTSTKWRPPRRASSSSPDSTHASRTG